MDLRPATLHSMNAINSFQLRAFMNTIIVVCINKSLVDSRKRIILDKRVPVETC